MQNRWSKFILLYVGGIFIAMSQFKISPTIVMDSLNLSLLVGEKSILLLASIFPLSAIFLTLPGGFIISKIGAKRLAIILMLCLFSGNILGYLMIDNYKFLLISRIIEGISYAMYSIMSVMYFKVYFKDRFSSIMGLFSTYPAVAAIIIFNVSHPISIAIGFRNIWLLLAIGVLSIMITFIFILEPLPKTTSNLPGDNQFFKNAISNKNIWFLALSQGCLSFILYSFMNAGPTMFRTVYFIEDTQADFLTSILGLFAIPAGIIAGIIIDKSKKPLLIALIGLFLLSICGFIGGSLIPFMIIPYLFLLAMAVYMTYISIITLATNISQEPTVTSYNLGIVNTVFYFFIVIGSPITLSVVLSSGWNAAFKLFGLIGFIGFLLLSLFGFFNKKNQA